MTLIASFQPAQLSALAPIIAGLLLFVKNSKQRNDLPPKSSLGLFETVNEISGNQSPWFYLKTAKELECVIYRLNLELVFGTNVIVVGDPKAAHEILTDPLTIKNREQPS